jgi:hypothetical protein
MIRFAPTACLFAVTLAATPVLAGRIGQVPMIGKVSAGTMSGHAGFGGIGAVSGVGMNVSNADGVTVQTNIDASRDVQGGTSVSINRTINGIAVSSTSGGDFLAGADTQAQDVWAQKQDFYQQLQNEASMAVQVWAPAY